MPHPPKKVFIKAAPSLKIINEGAVPSRNLFREGTAGQQATPIQVQFHEQSLERSGKDTFSFPAPYF